MDDLLGYMYGPSPECKQDRVMVEAVCSYVYGF